MDWKYFSVDCGRTGETPIYYLDQPQMNIPNIVSKKAFISN